MTSQHTVSACPNCRHRPTAREFNPPVSKCPACGAQNRFVFLESYSSPVKAVQLCEHIRARVIDDDGDNHFEFEVAHTQRPAEPGSPAAKPSCLLKSLRSIVG